MSAVTVYVPGDAGAVAVGAEEVARAIELQACTHNVPVTIVCWRRVKTEPPRRVLGQPRVHASGRGLLSVWFVQARQFRLRRGTREGSEGRGRGLDVSVEVLNQRAVRADAGAPPAGIHRADGDVSVHRSRRRHQRPGLPRRARPHQHLLLRRRLQVPALGR